MSHKSKALVACLAFLVVACVGLAALAGEAGTAGDTTSAARIDETFVAARVVSVDSDAVNEDLLRRTGIVSRRQIVKVEILEGPLAGKLLSVFNEVTDNPAYNIVVKPGSELILAVTSENGGQPEVNIADYRRAPVLGWLFAIFIAVFLYFGGKQGLKSLIGLAVCVGLICFGLLPASFAGVDPLVTAVLICLASTAVTMLFVAGRTRKAAAAMIGTVGGVIIAGVAAQAVIVLAPLTGLSSEEAQILRGSVLNRPPEFFSGLLAAGMLIGALGVIMDVGISIASAVLEVSKADRSLSVDALYKAGMNVGRDIMGTMTSTLVLAYAGGALPLLLLAAHMPSPKLLNLDLFATEIAAALTGSLGLVATIPLTALASARLMSGGQACADTVRNSADSTCSQAEHERYPDGGKALSDRSS